MNAGNAANPGDTKAYLTSPTAPAYIPAIPPPIIAAIKGFLSFNVTPYQDGSVIPKTAVNPEDAANCFNDLFLVFIATANVAPP